MERVSVCKIIHTVGDALGVNIHAMLEHLLYEHFRIIIMDIYLNLLMRRTRKYVSFRSEIRIKLTELRPTVVDECKWTISSISIVMEHKLSRSVRHFRTVERQNTKTLILLHLTEHRYATAICFGFVFLVFGDLITRL